MSGFQCNSCDAVFTSPDFRREFEKVDERPGRYVVADICPICESDELREVDLCEQCQADGADVLAHDDGLCKPCIAIRAAEAEDFRRDQVAELKPLVQVDIGAGIPIYVSPAEAETLRRLKETA